MKKIVLLLFISLIVSSNSTSPKSSFSSSKSKNEINITKYLLFAYFNNLKNNKNESTTFLLKKNKQYTLTTSMSSFPTNSFLTKDLIEKANLRYTSENQIETDIHHSDGKKELIIDEGEFKSIYYSTKGPNFCNNYDNCHHKKKIETYMRRVDDNTKCKETCSCSMSRGRYSKQYRKVYNCKLIFETTITKEQFEEIRNEWEKHDDFPEEMLANKKTNNPT